MKPKLLLFCLIICIVLTACDYSSQELESAYQSGYEEGYTDALREHEGDYSDGYQEGKYEAIHSFYSIVEDAEQYSVVTGGWHPEEAWSVIEEYQNSGTSNNDDSPSYEEYQAAIDSLICFYEYFYSRNYE